MRGHRGSPFEPHPCSLSHLAQVAVLQQQQLPAEPVQLPCRVGLAGGLCCRAATGSQAQAAQQRKAQAAWGG
jgi:hypothetical protein